MAASATVLGRLAPALAAHGLRGIAIDLPGLGLADRPEALDYSWGGLGRWATAAVDALELERFHLVVHDIGGPVGFELTAAVGPRVASLTLLNTAVDPQHFRQPWVMRPFALPVVGRPWLHTTTSGMFVRLLRWQGIADQGAATDDELAVHRELLTQDDGGRAALRVADVRVASRLPAKHFLQEDHAPQIADRVAALVDRAVS